MDAQHAKKAEKISKNTAHIISEGKNTIELNHLYRQTLLYLKNCQVKRLF